MSVDRYVDLHTHTTASDGSTPPRALVAMAIEKGLSTLAVSDHDSTEGLDEAMAAGRELGLDVIPAIELSTDIADGEVHVLGYLIDYQQPAFQATLRTLREARRGRAQKMVEKLSALGMPLEWAHVQRIAGDATVGRPHVARAMVEKGYVPDIKTAFDLYIHRNGPAYVERYKLTPADAIALVHSVGGVAVLAHPFEGNGNLHLAPELAPAGLDGVECYYTGYSQAQVQTLLDTAARYGLVATGGSDFHGAGVVADAFLGQPRVPYQVVLDLRSRWQSRQA